MNITFPTFATLSHWFTFLCAVGGLACIAAIVLCSARHILRDLLDQLYAASRLTKLVVFLTVGGATWYAGAKHGSPTNEPPADVSGDSSSTNASPEMLACGRGSLPRQNEEGDSSDDATGTSRPQLTKLPPQTGNEPPPSTSTFNLNLITNWFRRGAWCDWKRIELCGDRPRKGCAELLVFEEFFSLIVSATDFACFRTL